MADNNTLKSLYKIWYPFVSRYETNSRDANNVTDGIVDTIVAHSRMLFADMLDRASKIDDIEKVSAYIIDWGSDHGSKSTGRYDDDNEEIQSGYDIEYPSSVAVLYSIPTQLNEFQRDILTDIQSDMKGVNQRDVVDYIKQSMPIIYTILSGLAAAHKEQPDGFLILPALEEFAAENARGSVDENIRFVITTSYGAKVSVKVSDKLVFTITAKFGFDFDGVWPDSHRYDYSYYVY